jgi:protein ImuB
MPARRVLSLWFPRLEAERVARAEPQLARGPLAVVGEARGALVLTSLDAAAEAEGLRRGMALGDARAICPGLLTRPHEPRRSADTLAALRRWAGRFSPWVAEEGTEGLVLDVTGCAHLFGGEAGLVAAVEAGAAALGLTVRIGLADTLGAAWAVAHYAGTTAAPAHAGDAIDQEARATRSRASRRRWERDGAPPAQGAQGRGIVPPGGVRAAIGPLPVAALRLSPEAVAALQGRGLRRVEDLARLPRAQLARRIGPEVVARLDQALGQAPEPVSPASPAARFAVRLTCPEPIGTESDVLAGLDRLLAPLCARLAAAGQGARRVRLTLVRVDGSATEVEAGLARPADTPEAIRPLLALRLGAVDAGFGIEVLRLAATAVEPRPRAEHRGQLVASAAARRRVAATDDAALSDLLGRLGARLGLEALTRLHPAESHIPEKSTTVMAAGFTPPAGTWPRPAAPRPLRLFPPEPALPEDGGNPPRAFRWRRRRWACRAAEGPERIAPEWWLDDPAWRSGARDYWRVETETGERLWLYEAKGGEAPAGWFVHGAFS